MKIINTLVLSGATVGISFSATAANKPTKPNVLFLISDDLNTALSGFGHKQCKTPNLDTLAERGVKFQCMHCQFPLCGPSRASLMTGMYPYSTKITKNAIPIRDKMKEVITMSQAFRNQGYKTVRVSKIYHMGIPSEIIAGTAHSDDPESWDQAINVKVAEHFASGKLTNWSPKNKGSQAFNELVATGNDSSCADGMAADKAIEILDEIGDNPFFLAVGFVRPHVPFVAPSKYFEIYNKDDMQIPEVPENDLDDLPKSIRFYKSNKSNYNMSPENHKGMLRAYYASVSYMDAQVGRVLKALEKNGLRDNTIVVFTSDHGYMLGQHNKFQKQHLFEESTRVPFIISVPWIKSQHGKTTDKLTELIDLYPTLTEIAGVPAPDTLQGISLKPLLEDVESKSWQKDQVFTISNRGGESLRTKDWRFTQYYSGSKGYELYDLKKDPGEFINQAQNPEYADIFSRMKKQLLTKRTEAGYKKDKTDE